jgi:hypothetical protein
MICKAHICSCIEKHVQNLWLQSVLGEALKRIITADILYCSQGTVLQEADDALFANIMDQEMMEGRDL